MHADVAGIERGRNPVGAAHDRPPDVRDFLQLTQQLSPGERALREQMKRVAKDRKRRDEERVARNEKILGDVKREGRAS